MTALRFGAAFALVLPAAAALADTPSGAGPVPQPAPAAPAATAQPAPDLPADFLALFSDLCLNKFPDDAALGAAAEDKHATAMTPEQVRGYLHDDPGAGWIVKDSGGGADYVVLLEQPPFHACSVRHISPVLYSPKAYMDAVEAHVGAKGNSLAPGTPQRVSLGGGAEAIGATYPELDADRRPTGEAFITVIEYYPAGLAKDPRHGPLLEMRFVRQIYKKAN